MTLGLFAPDGSFDVLDFDVAEVLEPSAPWQDHFVYLRLDDLQDLLGVGDAVGALKLRLPEGPRGAAAAADRLRQALEPTRPELHVAPWKEAGHLFLSIIRATRIQAGVVESILLVAIALAVREASIDLELITRGGLRPQAAILVNHEDITIWQPVMQVDSEDPGAGTVPVGEPISVRAFGQMVRFDVTFVPDRAMRLALSVRVRDHRNIVPERLLATPEAERVAFMPMQFTPAGAAP